MSCEGYSTRCPHRHAGEPTRRARAASMARCPCCCAHRTSYTVAIEIALGSGHAEHRRGRTRAAPRLPSNYLKRSDSGRATFLPLSVIRGQPLNESGIERCARLLRRSLRPGARASRAIREIILNLLGRTVVAQDLDAAIAIANKFGHRFRIVTLDGQVLNAGGSMTGGSVVPAVRASCRAPTRSSVCRSSRRRLPAALDKLPRRARRRRSACWQQAEL